jgi:hypothetical protein
MLCSIPIEINDLLLVVTEFEHTPEQKLTFNFEYIPESFEVQDGYLVDIFNNELSKEDFWLAYEYNEARILDAVGTYFKGEEY